MLASTPGTLRDELARDIVEVTGRLCLVRPRGRRRTGDLKEAEILTLALLRQQGSRTVGDLQRQLGVLPAQVSRIIRSLEDRDRPFIACRINSKDKRKVDVTLTPAGATAYEDFQAIRVHGVAGVLDLLAAEELDDLRRLLIRIRQILSR